MIPEVDSGASYPAVDEQQDGLVIRLRDAEAQLRTAAAQLLEAEQAAARLGQTEEDLQAARWEAAEAERTHAEEVAQLRRELEFSEARADHLERVRADLQDSVSWKVTAPLRAAKRAVDARRA